MSTPSPIKISKSAYAAPVVTMFGSVAKLTAGGTRNTNEPTSGPDANDPLKKI